MASIANAFLFVGIIGAGAGQKHQLNSLHLRIYYMDLNLAIQGLVSYGYGNVFWNSNLIEAVLVKNYL